MLNINNKYFTVYNLVYVAFYCIFHSVCNMVLDMSLCTKSLNVRTMVVIPLFHIPVILTLQDMRTTDIKTNVWHFHMEIVWEMIIILDLKQLAKLHVPVLVKKRI